MLVEPPVAFAAGGFFFTRYTALRCNASGGALRRGRDEPRGAERQETGYTAERYNQMGRSGRNHDHGPPDDRRRDGWN